MRHIWVVIAVALALVPSAGASTGSYWSIAKVLSRLDGARVSVGGRVVRIVSASTLCSGEGAWIRQRGVRTWHRFACTYTTFTRVGVDRDLEFDVRVRDRRRFRIVDPHWVGVTR